VVAYVSEKVKNTDLAAYYFHQGTNFCSYDYLGCHENIVDGRHEYTFRVWAPNADSVMLVSDFTSWDNGLQMNKNADSGIFWADKDLNIDWGIDFDPIISDKDKQYLHIHQYCYQRYLDISWE
jgi:1,4-alpha-glucan branching enzyme